VSLSPDHVQLVIVKNVPLFFSQRDGPWFPTLRLLHQYPDMMPRLRADEGAIKFVLSGANIMAPGLTSAGATMHDEVPSHNSCCRSCAYNFIKGLLVHFASMLTWCLLGCLQGGGRLPCCNICRKQRVCHGIGAHQDVNTGNAGHKQRHCCRQCSLSQ
jgi:Pre-PUA-like domain/PUA domain